MSRYRFVAIRSGEPTIAVIDCSAPDNTPSREVLANIREGVRNWLGMTPEGQSAWESSSEDFNWGDLSGECSNHNLIYHLKAKQIFGLEVTAYVGDQYASNMLTYDEVFYPNTKE